MKPFPLALGLATIAIVGFAPAAGAQIDVNGLLTVMAEVDRARHLSGQCLAAIGTNGTAARAAPACQQFVTYWDATIIPNIETYQAIADSCDARQLPETECNAYADTLNAAATAFNQLADLLN